jgi:hypothetical protein
MAGTVSLSGTTLTGVGTSFTSLTANQDAVRLGGANRSYLITAITNDTTATVQNDDGDSYSGVQWALIPRVGDPITTIQYDEGDAEGSENLDNRVTVKVQCTTDLGRLAIRCPDVADAVAQGATHLRVYRSLESTDVDVARGADHPFCVDIAISGTNADPANKVYRESTLDDVLSGETHFLVATGYIAPPQGRFCDFDTRQWIGGNPDNPGYWFYSSQAASATNPRKYAAWFKSFWFKTCDPQDGQKDTGTVLFKGDRYFFKERKIFVLRGADAANEPDKISDPIGCVCPYSISRMFVPRLGGECIGFESEYGPAVLLQGGQVGLLTDFGIAELWPKKTGILRKSDGTPTSWATRNRVASAFHDGTWFFFFGDSAEPGSELSTNKIYGYHWATDGQSLGPMTITIPQYSGTIIYEPQLLIPIDANRAYTFSHTNGYRLTQFLDPASFRDTFISEGALSYSMVNETAYRFPANFTESDRQSMRYEAKRVCLYISFTDDSALVVSIYGDDGRFLATKTYAQSRQSGLAVNNTARRAIMFQIQDGMECNRFLARVSKVVPSTGAVEFFGTELQVERRDNEYEWQSTMEVTIPDFVIKATDSNEVTAY